MAGKYSFLFTASAQDDLDETLGYISEDLCNPSAAIGFLNKLEDTLSVICSFRLSGSLIDNKYVANKKVRKVVIGNYVLYYVPDQAKSEIDILRIIYSQRDREQIEKEM